MLLAKPRFLATAVAVALVATLGFADWRARAQETPPAKGGVVMPFTDAERGRELFVGKGCVVCHAVNGVGGTVAPPLDAAPGITVLDPFGFMARMWRGADAMLLLQGMELGYHIEFTGERACPHRSFSRRCRSAGQIQRHGRPGHGSRLDDR